MTPEQKLAAKTHNERILALSRTFSTGGLALFGGTAAVLYNGTTDGRFALLAAAGVWFIILSIGVVGYLRAQE